MIDKSEDTPPPSPGVGGGSGPADDDELFEDEVDEEIDVLDGEAEVIIPFNFFELNYDTLIQH